MQALLDRVRSKTRYIDWFRHFACKANGMPIEPDEPAKVDVNVRVDQPPGSAAAASGTAAAPAAERPATPRRPGWGKTAALVAASLLSGLGIGGGALTLAQQLFHREQPPATVEQPPREGSLLQYLEDQGYHLPSGE